MSPPIQRSTAVTRRSLILLAALAVTVALLPLGAPAAAQEDGTEDAVDITILHDTHFHGSFGELEPADPLQTATNRFDGLNRADTARLIAADAFGQSDTVVVASGQQFPDALAGSYLAGALEAPVLLVTGTTVPPETLAAMAELDAENVYIVGGTTAVGSDVEAAIAADFTVVDRLSGATRYETAAAIALAVDEVGTWDDEPTAILATGEQFPDALVAGAVSFNAGFPILLTTTDGLHPAAAAAMEELDISRVIVAGGGAAVSSDVVTALEALDLEVTRVFGANRWETALAFADFAAEELGFTFDDLHVATGIGFADALTIAPRAGLGGNPLVLTNGQDDTAVEPLTTFLADHACHITSLTVAGGTAAVTDENLASMVGPANECVQTEGIANIGRYMALIEARKADLGDNALFVANGDDTAPSLLSGVFEPNGIHMIEALNASPIDVNTFGNHEFDFGPETLRELLPLAEYPYVTANVRDIDSGEVFGADLGVEEFVTFERDGVTVGITGLAPQNMATITTLGPDTEQIDAVDALNMVVPRMQEAGAELIIVASHLCGTDARDVADTVEGVHAYVGDHCAEVLQDPYVSPDTGAIVSLVGDEFTFLGELTLSVSDGEVVSHDFTLHALEELPDLRPLPAVQEVVDDYNAQLDEQLNVVIGERTVDWDTTTTVIRTGEGAIGNFITDEMRAFHGADIAVQNSGGIRANREFEAGDITRREIAEILPFANTVVKAELEGATLLEALERSVDTYPAPSGAFLQVSGMSFTFDPSQPAGDRVVDVTIGDEPLDPTRTYTMATNDFTLGGGDAYDMFADRDRTRVLVGANEGPLLSTFLIQRIEDRDEPVDTGVEGRITTVSG